MIKNYLEILRKRKYTKSFGGNNQLALNNL